MRDRKLEERIELLKEFINEWVGFHNFLKIGAAGKVSPEKEEEFMKLKSLIARKYQHLTTLMGEGFFVDEKLTKTVSRVVSLKQVAEIKPEVGQRSIEDEWHSSFIRLNEDLGNMEGERAKLARVSRQGIVLSWMLPPIIRFLKSLGRAVLTLLIIAAILFVVFVGSYFIWREEGERFPAWARDRATEMGIIHFLRETNKKNYGTPTN